MTMNRGANGKRAQDVRQRILLLWKRIGQQMLWMLLLLLVVLLGIEAVFAVLLSRETAEKVSWVSTAIAPAAIIITGYLVKLQLDEAAIGRRGQLFEATASRMLDLDKFFIEHPTMRPYFYDGKPLPIEPEAHHRVMAIAELHVDFFDTELLRRKTFESILRDLPPIKPWIRDMFCTSPAMCIFVLKDRQREEGWYDEIHGLYSEAVESGRAAVQPHDYRDAE